MMRIAAPLAATLSLSLLLLPRAHADGPGATPAVTLGAAPSPAYAFGARAGGYGFRDTSSDGRRTWDDCRMDGLGVFGQRTFGPHLFAEAGFDLYTAQAAADGAPDAMDRISGITTVAAGARIPWRWISPYVQLGVGLEVTRVEMPGEGHTDRAVLPMGFFGVGAELRATRHVSLGANLRTNLLEHYDHDADAGGAMTREYEAASQGQLFLKYEI